MKKKRGNRKAIRHPKRTAIRHKRDKNGLYEGMPGVEKVGKELIRKLTEEDHKQLGIATGMRMFECFGRTNFVLSEKQIARAMKKRIEYLKRFGWRLEKRNQTLTTEEEKHALLSSKPHIRGI
jgi:hypothetical protein